MTRRKVVLFSYDIGDTIAIASSSPAVAKGIVYVGSWGGNFNADGKLSAFDVSCRRACMPLWSYTTDKAIASSPTVANGVVYVGSWGGTEGSKLYAFGLTVK